MKRSNKAYLSLGSNQGNRFNHIQNAIDKINTSIGKVTNISSVYETKSWGYAGANYYNTCVELKTNLTPNELIKALLELEHELGRLRSDTGDYTDRNIDLDILLYNNIILDSKDLNIPHPRMLERNFVLIPLVEIASELIYPLNNQTLKVCLANCKDDGVITTIKKSIKKPV